jgi:hypothetical protein
LASSWPPSPARRNIAIPSLQMPSRQERRKVSVGSMAFLIQISASSTIGPQSSQTTK